MKIVVIGRAFPSENTGMMGIFEYEQATALSAEGHEVIYNFCDTRSVKRLRKMGAFNNPKGNVATYGYHLPIGGLPQTIFSKIKTYFIRKVWKKLLAVHGVPDVIHVHFPLLTMTDAIWTELTSLGCPIIVTEHWSKVQTKNLEPHRLQLLQKITEEADAFLTVGEPLKKSIRELTGSEREIIVLPNMVSPLFSYQESEMDESLFEFIAVGRLVESKRFDIVIAAFNEAFKNNAHVRLTIVGGGPAKDPLKQQLTKQITLTGALSREETASQMQAANAYVSASPLETFGVPFIEALSCGKPVIGVSGNPLANYIDETNGFLVEPENVTALANAMKALYDKRATYNEKAIASHAAEHFSAAAIVTKLEKIYQAVTKARQQERS